MDENKYENDFTNENDPPMIFEDNAIEIIKSDDNNSYIEIFEKDGGYTYTITEKYKSPEKDNCGKTQYYWHTHYGDINYFYDTKDKAIEQAIKTKTFRGKWIEFANRFDDVIKNTIITFLGNDGYLSFNTKNIESNKIILIKECTYSYQKIIYLKNPIFSNNAETACIEISETDICVFEKGYRISYIIENETTTETATVDFSDIHFEIQPINYSRDFTWFTPTLWHQIAGLLQTIQCKKDDLGLSYLNDKEKELLPLCEFYAIQEMEVPYQFDISNTKATELFCDFARKSGNDYIVELTIKYANSELNSEHPKTGLRKKNRACKILQKELKKPESEKLARLILSEIEKATVEYPTNIDLNIAPDVLKTARETVTDILKQRGYEGEYPYFKKMSAIKGIKLLETQGQPICIYNEKHMACMIDCFERNMYDEENKEYLLLIDFAVSTVFLKKDELHLFDSLDGCSGFFPHKYRRRVRAITPNCQTNSHGKLSYNLEDYVTAAAKIAECEKITKKERNNYLSSFAGESGFLFYAITFLFLGFGFASLMCLAMFLVDLFIGFPTIAISKEASSFSEYFFMLLFEFPWLEMFLFCAVGFGLPMTIFIKLAKKRG